MSTQLVTNRAMVAMMPFMTLIMNGTSLLIVWFGGKAMDTGTMRSSMTQTNCTCWMSLVVRVMRDAVEKFSISALENPMTLAK
ncbi:hypothetical protein ACSTB0_13645, partial [Faecalibacterium wellingii]|uniref:hypothetical protein n=1 Tax=Faecalibacterium wellingii TaxID=2929491 RepID=UPI003ED88690